MGRDEMGVRVVAIGIVLAGAVGASRLALGAHTPADLYRGYGVGFAAVVLASFMV